MLGTRALQIFDETTCVVRAVLRWTEFYKHESCGKCTPCREGTWWLVQTLASLEKGQGSEADLDLLLDQCDNILGRSFCALGDGATSPITSSIQYFRDEYLAHLDRTAAARSTRPPPPSSRPREPAHDDDSEQADRASSRPTWSPLTIDGVQVSVPKDTLVIRAAEQVGVQIPRFCDHPLLDAGRRLPAVPGRHPRRRQRPRRSPSRRPPARSPVAEGMVVNTQATSAVADKAQQGIMEFLLINHPLDCPVCDKGGECPLQNQAMSNGRGESRFAERRRQAHLPQADQHLRRRCCSTASAACCAPAAPASPSRSPATRSSR